MKMGNSMQLLKDVQADRHLPASTIRTIAARATIASYKCGSREIRAGCDLFRPGAPCSVIYYLVDGCMFLYDLLEDGRRQILHFALPGGMLGLYPNRVAIYGAQALTDAVVRVISHASLGSLLKNDAEIGLQFMWTVWKERNLAYDHLSSVGRRSSRERVARLLLELFVRFRMRWPHHSIEEMHLPLTQEHIGDATGLTNVHVNRVLRDLREEGIVEFHYRRLRILNPDKLADVAGIDPHVALSWAKSDSSSED
jgi:CRP-like cAMP-binding protein